jgi:outer membrane receptor for ferrienterochelin and colicins
VFAEGSYKTGTVGLWHSKIKAPTWGSDRPDRVNYNASAVRDQRVTTVWIDQEWNPAERWTFKFGTNYARGELAPKSLFNNIFTEYQNGYIYLLGERTQLEARSIFETDGLRWISGISFGSFHAISSEADLSVPYDPDRPITEQEAFYLGTENTLKAKIFDSRYNNVGAFTEVVRQWNDRVRSAAGLRVDDHGLSETSFAPRVSLNLKLSDRAQLKGLFGASYKSPSPHTIYQHFGAFTGSRNDDGLYTSFFFRVPNTDLKPEESRTFEATFFHFPSETWSWSAASYYNVIDNTVESGPTETIESDFIPGGVIFDTDTNQNLGKQKTWGLNLSAQGKFRNVLGGRLSLWAHYDWLDGELTDPLEETSIGVPFASNHKLRTGFKWSRRGLTLSPRLYLFGSGVGPVTDPDDDNFGVKVPAYRLVTVFASWKAAQTPVEVYLRIENAFDERYNNIGQGGSSTFLLSPQDGRWLQFGLRFQYQ